MELGRKVFWHFYQLFCAKNHQSLRWNSSLALQFLPWTIHHNLEPISCTDYYLCQTYLQLLFDHTTIFRYIIHVFKGLWWNLKVWRFWFTLNLYETKWTILNRAPLFLSLSCVCLTKYLIKSTFSGNKILTTAWSYLETISWF